MENKELPPLMEHEHRFLISNYLNYIIIGVVSFVALVFLPTLASPLGLALVLPNTLAGWLVWGMTRCIIAAINVVLLYAFLGQGKQNIKNNPYFQEAEAILERGVGRKVKHPRSPFKWKKQVYGFKGGTLFLMSALSLLTLTQAVLMFDWVAFLTYLFTLIMGLVFGVINMKKAEEYWTTEYWQYAKEVEAELEGKEDSAASPEPVFPATITDDNLQQ